MQRRALLLHFDFDDFLGIVPSTTGVGHEDGLVQAEGGDGHQVADEEKRLDKGEGESREENRNENVEHALLRVLRTNFDDALAVRDAGGRGAVELDMALDEFNGAVSAGGNGLCGSTREPIDHGAAGDESKDEGRVEERKLFDVDAEAVRECHDD